MMRLSSSKPLQFVTMLNKRDLLLPLLIVTLYWQIWFDIGGVTLRSEDLLMLVWLGAAVWATPRVIWAKENRPILLLCLALAISGVVTLLGDYTSSVQKDAVINAVRLILALSILPLIIHDPRPAKTKTAHVLITFVAFSLVTTLVSLLQIGYWTNVWPFDLPDVLTTIRPEASAAFGKEYYALYLGNTGTHLWSAMLACQAIIIWIITRQAQSRRWQLLGFAYVALLTTILMATSVRNSILGLVISLAALESWRAIRRQRWQKTVLQFVACLLLISISWSVLNLVAPESETLSRIRQVLPRYADGRWSISRASNIFGRIEAIQIAWQLFLDQPLFGQGFWSFDTLQAQIPKKYLYPHAHNNLFQILAEMGLLGLLAWGGFFWHAIGSLRPSTQPSTPEAIIAWHSSLTILIFLLFTGLFTVSLWQPAQVTLWMIFLGLWITYQHEGDA